MNSKCSSRTRKFSFDSEVQDLGVYFGELRRLWAVVLEQVKEIKSLLDVLRKMREKDLRVQ
jgi:hypothetical protein